MPDIFPNFDVRGAYYYLTDDEGPNLSNPVAAQTIAKKLAKEANFDAEAAFTAGFTSEQVISKLTGIEARPFEAIGRGGVKGVTSGAITGTVARVGGQAGFALGVPLAVATGQPWIPWATGALGTVTAATAATLLDSWLGVSETAADIAPFGDERFLPSDLPMYEGAETLGAIAGVTGPLKAALKGIPRATLSEPGRRGAVAASRALPQLDKAGRAIPTNYVNFGAKRVLSNVAQMKGRAASATRAATERAQRVTLNPRTGAYERPSGLGRLPELAIRGRAAATRTGAHTVSGLGRVLRTGERIAVRAGERAREPGLISATDLLAAGRIGVAGGIAEAVDPGDLSTRLTFELPAALISPERYLAPLFRAARHPIKSSKGVLAYGNTRRSQMARDHLQKQTWDAMAIDRSLGTPEEAATRLLRAAETRPEAQYLSPGQITGHPAWVLNEVAAASKDPKMKQKYVEQAKNGLRSILGSIRVLNDSAIDNNVRVALAIEQGLVEDLMVDVLDAKLLKATQLGDKLLAKSSDSADVTQAGQMIQQALRSANQDARLGEKWYWRQVEKDLPVTPTNTMKEWDKLTLGTDSTIDELSPLTSEFKQRIQKLGAHMFEDPAPDDLLAYRTVPRAEGIIGDSAPAEPRVRHARQLLTRRVSQDFQRDEELRIVFGDPGRQIPAAYKAPAGEPASTDIVDWDGVAELLVQEGYMTQTQFTQGDLNRMPSEIAKDILREDPIHPADQQKWLDYEDATQAFADRALERAETGEFSEIARRTLDELDDAGRPITTGSVPVPVTVGELLKFRRLLNVESNITGAQQNSAVSNRVVSRLSEAAMKDLGIAGGVRNIATEEDPLAWVFADDITENQIKLARAVMYTRARNDIFHRAAGVGPELRKDRIGAPLREPEFAVSRILAGGSDKGAVHLQQIKNAMEFLSEEGALVERGIPRPPPEAIEEDPRSVQDLLLPGDPVEEFEGSLGILTDPVERQVEEGLSGINGAIEGFLRRALKENVLSTRVAETLPGRPAAEALGLSATEAKTAEIPTINRGPYNTFIKQYREILDMEPFAALKADLEDTNTAIILLDSALQQQGVLARNARNEVTLSRILGVENAGITFGEAVTDPNPEQTINTLIRTIKQVSRAEPGVEKDLKLAFRNAVMDWAYLGAGGAKNFDFTRFYDELYRTKDVVPTFNQSKSKNIMAILRDGGIITKEFEKNLKDLIGRAEVVQRSIGNAGPGGNLEDVVGADSFKMFATRFFGAWAGARVSRLVPGTVGSIQIPGYGATLAVDLFDSVPRVAFLSLLAELAEPGNAKLFADFLRQDATPEQQRRGLKRFFDYVGATLLASPIFPVSAQRALQETVEEEYEPAPPLPVEVAELPDMQPTMASPSMQQAAAPPPAPPMPSPQGQPVPQPPPGEGVTPERSQYAAYFPNDPISGLIRQQEQQGIAALMQQMQGQQQA